MLLSLHFIALKKVFMWVRPVCHLPRILVRVCPVNVVCYVNEFKGTGVNGGKQRDYFESILQYKNILVGFFLLNAQICSADDSHSHLTHFAPVVLAL